METERNEMNRRPGRIPIVVMTLLATLAVGIGAGAVAYSTFSSDTKTVIQQVPVDSSEPAATNSPLTAGQIFRNTHRGVVEITVGSTQVDPFGGEQQQRGQGSGFVIDSNGHIVTNDHVVNGANSVFVRFWNGETFKAEVMGTDASTDLAVIKVDAPDSVLHPVSLGDSSAVQVGDTVFALGSPFGLEESFTGGIVSAVHRQIRAINGFNINDSIQTDAAINHGNSGGPLLNSSGRVVGVNAQIRSDGGGSDGVGFAIPSDTVRTIAQQLIESGEVEHAYLGVEIQDVPASVADELGLVAGVQIASFPELESGSRTPAQKAGLRASTGEKTVDGDVYSTGGDVITEIEGQKITSSDDLQRAIDAKQPGDTISVTYWRNGDSHTVDVKLAARPEEGVR
jgi:S1-C subfamily serine protease